jgi:DNA-3-methyladenine glycosylase
MKQPGLKVPREFYAQRTLQVARALIGMHLIHLNQGVKRIGRIVETEAYQGPQDLAAHSARGQTPRTAVMFGPPGHAYVYLIYGMWHCVNIVTRAAGIPHAVLIRAVEPVAELHGGTHGPGLLCRAYGIDRSLNDADLQANRLWIESVEPAPRIRIRSATRIGVHYAGSWANKPWRFYDADSAQVSTLSAAQRRRLAASSH